MLNALRKFFAPPVFEDEDKTRRAAVLNVLLLSLLVITPLILIAVIASRTSTLTGYLVPGVDGIITLVLIWLMRRGQVTLAGSGLLLVMFGGATVAIANSGTLQTITTLFYIVAIVMAGIVISRRGAAVMTIITCITTLGLYVAQTRGLLPLPTPNTTITIATWVAFVAAAVLTLIVLQLWARSITDALNQARQREREVQALAASLEQRVADRTRALTASATISRQISTILDPRQLSVEVVEALKNAFNYYHAHIYLFDETRENLVLAGGTGEVGRTLLARGHQIAANKGLVGRAAKTNEAVLVADTAQNADWLPNPLLPDTRSEIAVPIAVGNQVVGVLDVQNDEPNSLTDEDARLIHAIADQVAIVVQNASQYTRTQKLAERRSQAANIGQQIQSAATIEETLQISVRELGKALGSRRTSIEVATPALVERGN